MGEFWKIFSHKNGAKEVGGDDLNTGNLKSENRQVEEVLDTMNNSKQGVTTEQIQSLVGMSCFSDETPVSEDEKAKLDAFSARLDFVVPGYLPPETVESYNPLDAKEYQMSDEGDQSYPYWPYIPHGEFFPEPTAAQRELIKEHEAHVRSQIKNDKDGSRSWCGGGF